MMNAAAAVVIGGMMLAVVFWVCYGFDHMPYSGVRVFVARVASASSLFLLPLSFVVLVLRARASSVWLRVVWCGGVLVGVWALCMFVAFSRIT